MARIYIETTVVSFYYNTRTEPEMVARQNWTRRWLDVAFAGTDELVTSLAVKSELDAGEFPNKTDMLALASRIPLLALNDAVAETVDSYISHHVMPNDPVGVTERGYNPWIAIAKYDVSEPRCPNVLVTTSAS